MRRIYTVVKERNTVDGTEVKWNGKCEESCGIAL